MVKNVNTSSTRRKPFYHPIFTLLNALPALFKIPFYLNSTTLFIFTTPFGNVAWAANETNSGRFRSINQNQNRLRSGGCPIDKLESCFNRVFPLMADPNNQMASCTDYERLSSCFIYVNCSQKETSEIGAKIFSIKKGVKMPKEFFISLLNRWKLRCTLECADYDSEECLRTMMPNEQDEDYALRMEMHSLKMQMAILAGSRSIKDLCANYRRAMLRWHQFRNDKCSIGDSTCQCKKEEKHLRSLCTLHCDKLQMVNGADRNRTINNIRIWIVGPMGVLIGAHIFLVLVLHFVQ